jgi:gluconate kinase
MVRIDFIGAPGSGKTTLINEMLARNTIKKASKLSEARRDVLDNFFSPKIESTSHRIKSFVIRKLLRKNYSTHSKRKLNEFFSKVTEEYDSLLGLILNNLVKAENGSGYLKYKRIGWFIQILEDTLLVSKHSVAKIVFCDESLSSKLLQPDFGLSYKDINKKLKDSLMPSAFVHVLCKEDVLNKRLLVRKKLTLNHSGMDSDFKEAIKESIIASDVVADKLLKLEIPCLQINSEDHIDDNLVNIVKFINQLK